MRSGKFGFLNSFSAIPSGSDPYWANVVSLMHFDGADGSTTIDDEKGRIWTPSGNAQIDTAQSKWGGSSLLLDGTGDYLSTPSASGLTLSADATIEMWIRPTVVSGTKAILTKRPSTGDASEFAIGIFGGKVFANGWKAGDAISVSVVGGTTLLANSEYFLEVIVSGASWVVALNGVVDGSGTASGPIATNSSPVYLGRDPTNATRDYSGHIDDFRWTSGIARAVELPTAAFPNY